MSLTLWSANRFWHQPVFPRFHGCASLLYTINLSALTLLHGFKDIHWIRFCICSLLQHKWAALDWTIWLYNNNQCQSWRLQFTELRMDPKSRTKDFMLLWLQFLLRAHNVFRVTDYGSSIQLLFEGGSDWKTEQSDAEWTPEIIQHQRRRNLFSDFLIFT